jgi:DNA-binding CsgD family transcriptional regulator/tetratricopeptide (TPR) repeat protein
VSTIHASPLVGRTAELRALGDGLASAAAGRATAVLLSGEAGIGKSRLAEDTIERARAAGFRVLLARASPLQAELHYGVLVDALRPLVREGPAGAHTTLIEGLPELGRLFDGTGLPSPEPLGDPNLERTRLFETVRELLARACRRQPLLLVVDDLQWADHASVTTLEYCLRGPETARLLLLLTHRSGEGDHHLQLFLAALRRLIVTTELELDGLEGDQVAELAAHLLGDDAPEQLLDLLAERARGVPLFVRGILGSLIKQGSLVHIGGRWVLGPVDPTVVPGEVRTLVRARLDELGAARRRIVDVLAVAGGAIAPAALQAIVPDAEDHLAALLDAGLITEALHGGAVQLRFTHPLLGEVAYQALPAVVRGETHTALLKVLRHETADLDVLAHHLAGAGDRVIPGEALEVLAHAARRALEMRDGAAAARHALSALRLTAPAGQPGRVPEMLETRAEGLQLAGWTDAARAAWADAARESTGTGDREGTGRRLRRLAQLDWESGHVDDALTHLDEAVAALAAIPPGEELVAALSARTIMLQRGGRDVAAAAAELERIAVRAGSVEGRVRAALARAGLAAQRGTIGAARLEMANCVALASSRHLPLLLAEVTRAQATLELEAGNLPGSADIVARGLAEARRLGVPTLAVSFLEAASVLKIQNGDWDGTLTDAGNLLQLAHRTGNARGQAYAVTASAFVHAYRGDLTTAAESAREARALYGLDVHSDRHLLTMIDVLEGEIAMARRRFEEVIDRLHGSDERRPAMVAAAAVLVGEAMCALGQVDEAASVAASLGRFGGVGTWPAAMAARLRAVVAKAEGDLPAAARWFARSGELLDALGFPYPAALSWLGWAEARAKLGPDGGTTAESLVSRVTEQVERLQALGARPAADRARRVLRALGRRPAPARPLPRVGPLSARELEIARLVADGLGNAAIAERLFISPRTVTTHLQHTYSRLGISSRAALARYVVTHEDREYVGRTMPSPRAGRGQSSP